VIAQVDRYSFGLAVDATHVYWVDYDGGGGVFRAPKQGGAREMLAGMQPFTRDVAVDDAWVYWALNTAGMGAPPGAIMRMPKAGGTPSVFAADQWNPSRVLVTGGQVLWNATAPGVVRSASPAGGAAPRDIVSATVVQMTERGGELIYADADATLHAVRATGGAPRLLTRLGQVPNDIAADDDAVYVVDQGTGEVPPFVPCKPGVPCAIPSAVPKFAHGTLQRVARADGARTVLARDLAASTRVAVDDSWIYVGLAGGVTRLPKTGGAMTSFAPGSGPVSRIVVSGNRVYFQQGQDIVSMER
jgi:hypothetical protein